MNDQELDRSNEWIASGGGPLLVLPIAALPYWNGADDPDSGVIPSAEGKESDYTRACSVHDWIGVIPVGPADGLVLADEPLDTRWWKPDMSGPTYLVRWVYGDSSVSVLEALAELSKAQFEPTGVLFENGSDRVVLFDSAMPGTDILTPYSSTELPPGTYGLDLAHFEPNHRTKLIVLRMTCDR